jgi:membrane-associated protease RseP (regulator of RpoE activity)
MEVIMKPSSSRWSLAGIAAGALCLALAATPALAQDDEDSTPKGKVRIYEEDSPELEKGEVRIYRDEDSNRDEDSDAPESRVRREIRVRGNDNDNNEDAQVRGGYLGVRVQDITRELQRAKDLPRPEGALINRVEVESPAADAGIRRGDVIVELDGNKIGQASDLISQVRDLEPGAKVPVVVIRNGTRKSFTVTLGKRPKEFGMFSPRGERRFMERADGDLPEMPQIGQQLDRIRSYRHDIQRQLDEIQSQLTRLRERDLQRLENEIRALRDELRDRDERRAPRPD